MSETHPAGASPRPSHRDSGSTQRGPRSSPGGDKVPPELRSSVRSKASAEAELRKRE